MEAIVAKRRDVKITPAERLAEMTPDLSTRVKKAIKEIATPFRSFVKDFAAISVRREELAPKFMKAANLWMAETKGTFVDFVRHLDPEVGNTRNEYRSHRSYQAADYLRRLVANASRREATGERGAATAPSSPTDVAARLLASLMEIIPEDRQIQIWNAMSEQLHWTPRQVQRMQTQVKHVDPLVHIRARVENLRLSFPTVEEPGAEERRAAA